MVQALPVRAIKVVDFLVILDEVVAFVCIHWLVGTFENTKGAGTNRSKKKNRRRKDQSKVLHDLSSACHVGEVSNGLFASSSACSKFQDSAVMSFSLKVEFDDGDIDDDIDPALKEELDREVEDFARRLNSDWPERMQEILSLGQERRLITRFLFGGL
ncbi:SKP1-like protein 21 [Juglans regia]|uniref:SKP1-like protein 21 n=1 Tax=Juglans regia TaxID=51240 RepID=A0A6P9EC03_JUGRE|nr:SKP1-like protein 21 [Juglans regia]